MESRGKITFFGTHITDIEEEILRMYYSPFVKGAPTVLWSGGI